MQVFDIVWNNREALVKNGEKSEKNSPERKKNSPILPGFELEPLLKALPVLLFLIDRDGTFLNFHAGSPDDLPLPPEQIVGANIRDLPDAKLGKQTLASLKRVFRTGTPERFEYRVETRRGWQHYVCHLRRYGVNEVLASIRNITEQAGVWLQLERALAEREALLHTIPDLCSHRHGQHGAGNPQPGASGPARRG